MANIKSAKKRINTNARQKGENKYVKATIATMTKSFRKLVAEDRLEEATKKLAETISYIDSACSKGIIHKNNAARKVSRLSAHLDAAKAAKNPKQPKAEPVKEAKAEVKKEVKAEPAKKAAAPKKAAAKAEPKAEAKKEVKKPAAKKAPAKKAEAKAEPAKKAPAKKPAVKKATK